MTSQAVFHAALRDAGQAVPNGLLDRADGPAGKRFDVYRNNVTMSLTQALEDGFPATARLLGAANFTALARQFVAEHAPKSPLMFLYCAEFPRFLAGVTPLAHLEWLEDVATLEWQMRLAYHAADATPIDPAHLTPDALMGVWQMAPAVRMVRSDWPVAQIRAYALGTGPAPDAAAQSVLITRPDYDPVLTVLDAPQADLVAALLAATPLATALDATPKADLAALVPLILGQDALTGVTPAP